MERIQSHDVQGLIRSGYPELPHARYYLVALPDDAQRARDWLADLLGEGIQAANEQPKTQAVNVAFTHAGLGALGLDRGARDTFPPEFQEGAAAARRCAELGDAGSSRTQCWSWGRPEQPLHAVLLLYAADAAALEALATGHENGARRHAARLTRLDTLPLLPGSIRQGLREHFGFSDGLSQPAVEGWDHGGSASNVVRAGEFVLGYENEYCRKPDSPQLSFTSTVLRGKDFGRNGSFLVLRQLEQDVAGFWRFALGAAQGNPERALHFAARLVGRWPDGAPLATHPGPDDPGPLARGTTRNFSYWRDGDGLRCPLGAHVRRANPRDRLAELMGASTSRAIVNHHRLLRRGRPYGPRLAGSGTARELLAYCATGRVPTTHERRGLHFLCVNASLTRQFEFVQRNWLNGPDFVPGEQDPLLGDRVQCPAVFTLPDRPFRRQVRGLGRFVHVRGSGYFFLPSLRALRFLVSPA